MLPSRSICTCTSCVDVLAVEPPAGSGLHRRLDDDVAEEIARLLAAHALDPLAAHAEGFAGLGFGGHADLGGAVERGDRDLAAEGSGRDGDRHLAMQVVMVALEYGVRLDVDLHVEVSRRAAVHAGLAFAREPHAVAFVDAGGDLHGERLLQLDATTSGACAAWMRNDASRPVAARTSLRNRERTL